MRLQCNLRKGPSSRLAHLGRISARRRTEQDQRHGSNKLQFHRFNKVQVGVLMSTRSDICFYEQRSDSIKSIEYNTTRHASGMQLRQQCGKNNSNVRR